jgi:hypothetical protein
METVIFLDIDGVLNPRVHWGGISGLSGPTLGLAESHLALVRELSTLGQVVWASTWPMEQTARLVTVIGLPPDTPSVNFTQRRAESSQMLTPTWKLPFLEQWLRRQERIYARNYQAIVWIDDDLYPDADVWAHASSSPTLLLRTDPAIGLTCSGVATVRTFLSDAK